jgi:hypothetical protein
MVATSRSVSVATSLALLSLSGCSLLANPDDFQVVETSDAGLDASSEVQDAGPVDALEPADAGPDTHDAASPTAASTDAPMFECVLASECAAPPNVAVDCVAFECVEMGCVSGFAECDANPDNGCERPLGTATDCMGCGDACAGVEVCDPTTGCAASCSGMLTACGGRCVELETDAAHCGMCDMACATPPNAEPVCAASTCDFVCVPGFGDCTASPGCETDVSSDPPNCGTCGRACDGAHGNVLCVAGECTVDTCNVNRGDCDGVGLNGCETNLSIDVAHCGACGRACDAGSMCANGECLPYVDGDFGADHTCVVRADGRLLCWGRNDSGQSDPARTPRSVEVPTAMRVEPSMPGSELLRARDVGLGRASSCAVMADGTIGCWGANELGQLGDGTTTSRARPTSPTGLPARPFSSVDGWRDHFCALDTVGEVWCWGVGSSGETGMVGSSVRTAVRVSLPSPARAVAVADRASCAVLGDGSVWCWGLNLAGRLGRGDPSDSALPPASIASGPAAARALFGANGGFCVVDAARDLHCWGSNTEGQYAPIASGTAQRMPVPVARAVDSVALGALHLCWWSDGAASCRGRDVEGQRGHGPGAMASTTTDVRVAELDGLRAVFSGRNTSCGMASGRMRCFGPSGTGEIPRAELLRETATRTFTLPAGVSRIGISTDHACLTQSGTLYCMGSTALATSGSEP